MKEQREGASKSVTVKDAGKIKLRLSPAAIRLLERVAEKENRSVESVIVSLVKDDLAKAGLHPGDVTKIKEMLSVSPSSKKPKATPPPAASMDVGRTAYFFIGGAIPRDPKKELGPTAIITENKQPYGDVVAQSILAAGGIEGTAFEIKSWEHDGRRVFVFSPHELPDSSFLRFAGEHEKVKFSDVAVAHKNLKWIKVRLRGKEFMEYLRRVIDVGNPGEVVISPLEYYFGDLTNIEERILDGSGWRIPPELRSSVVGAAHTKYHDPYHDGNEDPDDPTNFGDSWKGGR